MDRTIKYMTVEFAANYGGIMPMGREDDVLQLFDTEEAARQDIAEHVADVAEAVKNGDMSDEYSIDDYDVVKVEVVNPTAEPALQKIIFTYQDDTFYMRRKDEDFSLFFDYDVLKEDFDGVHSIRRNEDEAIFDVGQLVKFEFGKNKLQVKGVIERFDLSRGNSTAYLVGKRMRCNLRDLQHDY